jgi:gas vesicle protein GvpL/GvpF
VPRLLLHAIVPTDTLAAPSHGLRGWPLHVVQVSGLTGWATAWPADAQGLGRDDLQAHHALVSLALGACLPVRLPTWFDDEQALRQRLQVGQATFNEMLRRVRGKVELAVTATWQSDAADTQPTPDATAAPGRRFLEERQRHYAADDRRRGIAQSLADQLGRAPDVLEAQHRVCPSKEIALSSAFLVPLEAAVEVRERFGSMVTASPDNVRILVNGPWPPYSFTRVE